MRMDRHLLLWNLPEESWRSVSAIRRKKLPSEYKIKTVWCDEKEMKNEQSTCVRIDRELLEKLSVKETHRIKVELM